MSRVGLVAIGRNEGTRLRRCLESAINKVTHLVYVDSGSADGSIDMARSLGVDVVELDLSIPFTAARARNAGFARLLELDPQLQYIQFVDGDCEIVDGWLDYAVKQLEQDPTITVVCGRRRERFPKATFYNAMCDIEWDTPVGEAKACGGDAMMRVTALQAIGGYNPTLIAGEEPELCIRLRQKGGRIVRVDAEMTLHDAQITRFRQWWQRSVRTGYAYAEGAWLHGAPPEKHWVKETRSIRLWGILIPTVTLLAILPTKGLSLLLLAGYSLMAYRASRAVRPEHGRLAAILFGIFCMLAKFPQAQGQLRFYWGKVFNRPSQLIEYSAEAP